MSPPGLSQALLQLLVLGGHKLGGCMGEGKGPSSSALWQGWSAEGRGVAAPSRVLFLFKANKELPQSRECLDWALVTSQVWWWGLWGRASCPGTVGRPCSPLWVWFPGTAMGQGSHGVQWVPKAVTGPCCVLAAGCFMRPRDALCPSTAEIRRWDPLTWAAE